jgi:hypothetical protein
MRGDDEFGILVGLWCNKVWDRIDLDGAKHPFCFGFLAGEIVVDLSSGGISNRGRLEVEAGRFRIVQTETDQSKKDGAMGGQLGIEVPKWLGFARGETELGGHLNRTVSKIVQREDEQYRVYWRVADAGFNFWRVFGVGLNEDNILENRIIGDEPLCTIVPDGAPEIKVTISFRCDLRDLWFRRESSPSVARDNRFDSQQEDRNRAAVATRIVAIALNRNASEIDANAPWGTVTLAVQKLKSVHVASRGVLSA